MTRTVVRRPRAQTMSKANSAQTIVVVGPRSTKMGKLFQKASPYRESVVSYLGSPQALMESHVGAKVVLRPLMYVFNTANPTPARRRKVWESRVQNAPSPATSGMERYVAWIDVLRAVQRSQPDTPVLVVADEQENEAWDAFLEAGADELITPAALKSPAVVKRRIESAFAHARADSPAPTAVVEADDPLTETQITEALKNVRAAVKARPTATQRRGPLSDLLAVTVPELRAASGRFDAKRIAGRLGVSLSALATATPVSRETLRANPDSKRIQAALDPFARALSALDTLLPGEGGRQWLNTPHPRLDAAPLAAMLAGRADDVARLLELAREGDVD